MQVDRPAQLRNSFHDTVKDIERNIACRSVQQIKTDPSDAPLV